MTGNQNTGLLRQVACLMEEALISLISGTYHNDPKFSDRQVWANSADPDQTEGAVWSGFSLKDQSDQGLQFAILSVSFGHMTYGKTH